MYVMQDELTQLKAENALMKQRDQELTAKYDQVQRDNEEMKAQIVLLMKQTGLTKNLYLEVFDFCYILFM